MNCVNPWYFHFCHLTVLSHSSGIIRGLYLWQRRSFHRLLWKGRALTYHNGEELEHQNKTKLEVILRHGYEWTATRPQIPLNRSIITGDFCENSGRQLFIQIYFMAHIFLPLFKEGSFWYQNDRIGYQSIICVDFTSRKTRNWSRKLDKSRRSSCLTRTWKHYPGSTTFILIELIQNGSQPSVRVFFFLNCRILYVHRDKRTNTWKIEKVRSPCVRAPEKNERDKVKVWRYRNPRVWRRPHVALCVLIMLNFYADLGCPGQQWFSNLIILRDTVVGYSETCLMFAVTVLFVVLMSMFWKFSYYHLLKNINVWTAS